MEDQSLMSLLLLSFLLCIFLNCLLGRKTSAKRLPPGPWPLPIIGHLHLLQDPFQRTLHKLSSKYGHVMLLKFGARKVVVVSSPEAVEECFGKNDIFFADRPQHIVSKIFRYGSTATFAMAPYNDHFRNVRRIVNMELLSSNRVSALGYIRQEEVHSLLKQLLGRCSDSKLTKVELKSLMVDLSFNILTRMIAGKRYYGRDETSAEAMAFREIIGEVMELLAISKLEDHLPLLELLDFHGIKKRAVMVMKRTDELLQKLVDDRRAFLQYNDTNGAKEAMSTTLIDVMFSQQDSNPEYNSDQSIKSVMLSLLLAGTETPSTTLEWAMTFLLNNPETMQITLQEIETCVGKFRLLDENDLPKLVYLHNVIEETLRLSSPVPLLIPHESSDDCRVCGFDIPKGTMLLVNAWAIQRDPKLWEEATKFKPERFDNLEKKGHALLPFGMGRRACPGANLGKKFLALALGSMIQCFSWERENEEMIDITEVTGLTMQKKVPLEAMCKPRQIILDSFTSNPLFLGSQV